MLQNQPLFLWHRIRLTCIRTCRILLIWSLLHGQAKTMRKALLTVSHCHSFPILVAVRQYGDNTKAPWSATGPQGRNLGDHTTREFVGPMLRSFLCRHGSHSSSIYQTEPASIRWLTKSHSQTMEFKEMGEDPAGEEMSGFSRPLVGCRKRSLEVCISGSVVTTITLTNLDGQPAKRRGPKPDSKPAQTRRQELNRQAQRYVPPLS